MSDYWNETVAEIFSDHGIHATVEQIKAVAEDIDGAASVRREIEGSLPYRETPIEHVQVIEKHFSTCSLCAGSGITPCGHSHTATCLKCDGKGRVLLLQTSHERAKP